MIEKIGMISIGEPDCYDIITDWLKGLSERCNELIEKRMYEGQDWNTIADSMRYSSAANARNQIYKCLEKIRKKLN